MGGARNRTDIMEIIINIEDKLKIFASKAEGKNREGKMMRKRLMIGEWKIQCSFRCSLWRETESKTNEENLCELKVIEICRSKELTLSSQL